MRTFFSCRPFWALSLGLSFFAWCAAVGQDEANPTIHVTDSIAPLPLTAAQLREQQANAKIQAELDNETRIDVIELELGQLIRDLAKEHKLTIVLDPEGVEKAGVTPDQLVTLELKGISLRSALRILLGPLHLAAVVRNEVVVITGLDCDEERATIRTFPLGDLVKRVDDPNELLTTLEMIWPDAKGLPEGSCKPRATIVASHLVVRGSPRHHDLTEQLIDGLTSGQALPKVKEAIEHAPADPAARPARAPAKKKPAAPKEKLPPQPPSDDDPFR